MDADYCFVFNKFVNVIFSGSKNKEAVFYTSNCVMVVFVFKMKNVCSKSEGKMNK